MLRLCQILVVGLILLSLLGCESARTPSAQVTPANAVPVTVKQLMERSEEYAGHSVILTGKIVVECSQGCWFLLNDGTGLIYVDLQPAGLTIPQKVGVRVTVRGKIKGSGGNLQILGEAVEFLE
jgi:uncharacterized protein YdeI (BOF family)